MNNHEYHSGSRIVTYPSCIWDPLGLCVLDADAHADADAQSDAQSDADEIFHVHDKNDRPNVSSVGLPGHHI